MNSSSPDPLEWERLLSLAADGLLDVEDEQRLAEILKRSPQARRDYLRAMELGAMLAWEAPALAPASPKIVRLTRRAWLTSGLAASITAAGGLAWFFGRPSTRTMAMLESVQGRFVWTDLGGKKHFHLAEGARLAAGRLVLRNEDSLARLVFDDGTAVVLTGPSDVLLADENGKSLTLRRGSLSAEVAKQPVGRPMRILTPTADIEVLGTTLAVNAGDDVTRLDVEEGLVRFKRLADGRSIEVPGFSQATARAGSADRFESQPQETPPDVWHADLTGTVSRVSVGELVPTDIPGVQALAATPYGAGRGVSRYGICVGAKTEMPAVATLRSDSVVRMVYRSAESPEIMLLAQRKGGHFGGNFELQAPHHGRTDADPMRWRTIEIPVKDFIPIARNHRSAAGKQLRKVLISNSQEYGFELRELSILRR